MTRDQAIEICKPFWGGSAPTAVNTLEALGVLKLDQPRSVADKLHDSLKHTNIDFMTVWAAIERAGLKLVDK